MSPSETFVAESLQPVSSRSIREQLGVRNVFVFIAKPLLLLLLISILVLANGSVLAAMLPVGGIVSQFVERVIGTDDSEGIGEAGSEGEMDVEGTEVSSGIDEGDSVRMEEAELAIQIETVPEEPEDLATPDEENTESLPTSEPIVFMGGGGVLLEVGDEEEGSGSQAKTAKMAGAQSSTGGGNALKKNSVPVPTYNAERRLAELLEAETRIATILEKMEEVVSPHYGTLPVPSGQAVESKREELQHIVQTVIDHITQNTYATNNIAVTYSGDVINSALNIASNSEANGSQQVSGVTSTASGGVLEDEEKQEEEVLEEGQEVEGEGVEMGSSEDILEETVVEEITLGLDDREGEMETGIDAAYSSETSVGATGGSGSLEETEQSVE